MAVCMVMYGCMAVCMVVREIYGCMAVCVFYGRMAMCIFFRGSAF